MSALWNLSRNKRKDWINVKKLDLTGVVRNVVAAYGKAKFVFKLLIAVKRNRLVTLLEWKRSGTALSAKHHHH